ncbi:MAG: hypothetical protein Fur0018_06240 [Anaerolineales bacterium]
MNRLGFHYFPDAEHYRQQDLTTWLPRLQALGAGWVTLRSSSQRAIPEFFLRGLLEAGLRVVVHLPLQLCDDSPDLKPILDAYAQWGVKHVLLFERPNLRSAGDDAAAWLEINPVSRFVQRFLPLAQQVCDLGMQPVTPPLQPGGNYWDTAFLRAALAEIAAKAPALVDTLAIGLLAHAGEHPLDWGAGGPERWPEAHPYYVPPNAQDQRGFAIFDWYNAIAQAVCNRRLPLLAFEAGSPGGWASPVADGALDEAAHRERTLRLMQAVDAPETSFPGLPELPENLLVCHFLAVADDLPHACYTPDGQPSALGAVRLKQPRPAKKSSPQDVPHQPPAAPGEHPLGHYILLPPASRQGTAWQQAILPALLRIGATIGFSPREAALARQVTILAEEQKIPEDMVQKLRARGCRVVVLNGSGTELAHFLMETLSPAGLQPASASRPIPIPGENTP